MRSATGLRAAHEQFVSSRRTAPDVRPLVAASWARSAAGGASTDGGTLPAVRLHAGELGEYRDEHPLAPLLPVFRELLGEDARDDDYIFAIADVDGTLLWVEGERGVLAAAERMNFVEGAVWTEIAAGTNAPGTALAVGRPVQIFGPEHYNTVVQPWSCSAAPIRDPDGRLLGAVDITGGENLATPRALALVRATARAVEAELARRAAVADGRALRAYAGELGRPGGYPAALLAANGRVLHAADSVLPEDLVGFTTNVGDPLVLPDGRLVRAEPVGADGHLLVSFAGPNGAPPARLPLRLTALGRDCAVLETGVRTHRLRRRHSEVVVALALAGGGVTGGRLAVDLSDAEIPLVSLRVEMSRLRSLLGPEVIGSRPYQLRAPIRADFLDVRDLLAAGGVGQALSVYAGPLLPSSDAPVVAEFREVLEQQLRGAVLASGDAGLLRRWVDAPWGSADARAWRSLADSLPGGSPQR
ncbi:MAG: GAF domain-containing protein, partial [Kribbellaceae bacterium]